MPKIGIHQNKVQIACISQQQVISIDCTALEQGIYTIEDGTIKMVSRSNSKTPGFQSNTGNSKQQEVNNDETEEFASSIDAIFSLISNTNNDRVQTLFENIAKTLIKKEKNKKVEKEDEKINNKNKQKEKDKCIIC